jgi:hypothetical protein
MYIRFVADESSDLLLADGIITVAAGLQDDGKLHEYEVPMLDDIFEWLNDNLPCPPFRKNLESGCWTRNAVAWLKDKAAKGELVGKFWEIVAVLKEHNVLVKVLRTKEPGYIVYEDDFQIVAEIFH